MIDFLLLDCGGVSGEERGEGFKIIAVVSDLDGDNFIQTAVDLIHERSYIAVISSERYFWNALRRSAGIKVDNAFLMHELCPFWMDRIFLTQKSALPILHITCN